jgi:hypothetical protein
VTLEQLKSEIRNAYDSRDRERMEWALAQIAKLIAPKEPK